MLRSLIIICGCLVLASLATGEELTATLREQRAAAPNEDNRQGLQMVSRDLNLGVAAIRYRQLVDPAKQDAPVRQRYGDYLLGCEFPRYTWNWDLEYFIEVIVERPGQPPISATTATLQQGMYILQQGSRVVADMVWPLPAAAGKPAADMAIRLITSADDPQWLYLRAGVEGDPEARISQVKLRSYPTTTSGPPERQRWVSTPTREVQMGNAPQPLQPDNEWALTLHNRMAQEDGGTFLVMDPREVKTASAAGIYPIEVTMRPDEQPLRELHVAMSYFVDTPWEKAAAALKQVAPERLKRLQALDWTPPVDVVAWQKEQAQVEELLNLTPAARQEFGPEWQAVLTRGQQALQALQTTPTDSAAARSFVINLRQAQDLRARLYDPAIRALVDQATQ